MKPQFYLLGFVRLGRGGGHLHEIAVCFEPIAQPVGIAEGIGQGAGGRLMSAAEAIGGVWERNFRATRSEWLLPHLRRLTEGTPLPREEIFAQYRQVHGGEPQISNFGDCLPGSAD